MIAREPIIGWRQWNFMYPHFLASLGNDTIYVPREKVEARCEPYSLIGTSVHQQQSPHLTCTCGIHAYKEKLTLLRQIRHEMAIPAIYSGLRLVYGEINLWGKVIEHEDGYRAQFGYPKRLWCTTAIEPLAGWIGYIYGVPCEVLPSEDDEEIKSAKCAITRTACGSYYHIGFCLKCFVVNIKAKRMRSKRE